MGLIGICAAVLLGVAAGDLLRLDASRLATAAVAAVIGAVLGWRKPAWRLLALATCAAALGAARASTAAGDGLSAPAFVAAESSSATSGRPMDHPLDHRLDQPVEHPLDHPLDQPMEHPIDHRLDQPLDRATDHPVAGPTARPSVGQSIAAPLADLRAAIERGVRRYLPEPQASLALGVLLGGSGQLDAATRVDLQRSGLAHLVAIDGLKQVLVAAALGKLSARLVGPYLGALPVLVGIAAYTLLTGGHPSAVRAGLMVGLATLGSLAGRVADPLTSLLLAVVLMAAVQPRVLLDVGLQLSFSATLGIVLLWPRLRPRLRRLPRWIAEPVGLTLAVSLATLPLMVSAFQVVSLVSPLAHVVALPLLSAVLVTTALLAAAAPLAPLGVMLGWLAWLPATLLLGTIRFFGSWPAAAVSTGRPTPLAALGLALVLLAWGVWGLPEVKAARLALKRRRELGLLRVSGLRSPAGVPGWSAPAACIGTLLAAGGVLAAVRPDGQLHVERLSLARGEAVFIRGPTGRTALVVRGPAEAPSLVREVAGHLALWEHKLDAAVQLDASAGKALTLTLSRYPADQQLVLSGNDTARQITLQGTGDVDLGGGAVLEVARPDGRVSVRYRRLTSGPTTSAARPGSAD